ncbi:VOC family protein [Paenibacillus psychroresistens]|uniref:VOC family protein n=1 Tax=Paenibacillus psychroresistens TaxID=1778678 RepID=A0A6B8RU01_9BACL|nr:VOC family protein [Paenibacillus psychroresistens]QGQ99055.1 VOC family protein [Paenibacillus psychroresistens]
MAKHTTYIFSHEAKAQAEYYIQALGGEILSIMTYGDLPNAPEENKDKVIHLCVRVAGVAFFMSDNLNEAIDYGSSINLNLEFETEYEAHSAFDNLAAGGQIKAPLKLEFWGSLFGIAVDKYGVSWMITTVAKSN